jgi:tight adherence protein C
MLPEIRKFTSTLIQGISRGNSELSPMLIQQSREVWELKKQIAHRKGAMANDTLLAPMCLTFVGILIMVMVPIFANLGV